MRLTPQLGVLLIHDSCVIGPDPNPSLNPTHNPDPSPAGCEVDRLFVRGSWNAAICDAMTPAAADHIIEGERGAGSCRLGVDYIIEGQRGSGL